MTNITESRSTVELDSLVGDHILYGVDCFVEPYESYGIDERNCIRFNLDKIVYTAYEDPNDGYRSMMSHLEVSLDAVKNEFTPINVHVRKKPNGEYSENDTLQFIDINTLEIVLEVGTDNTNDYYPYFVSSFDPRAMVTNQDSVFVRITHTNPAKPGRYLNVLRCAVADDSIHVNDPVLLRVGDSTDLPISKGIKIVIEEGYDD